MSGKQILISVGASILALYILPFPLAIVVLVIGGAASGWFSQDPQQEQHGGQGHALNGAHPADFLTDEEVRELYDQLTEANEQLDELTRPENEQTKKKKYVIKNRER